MKAYAGIDLHSSNNYIGIMDQDYKKILGRRQPNDLNNVLKVLEPFKTDLEGVIVESTYKLVLACRWVAGAWLHVPSGQSVGDKTVRRHKTHG